ncbi:hypothetical protein O181_023313 [Austropuccinia psidii MF-1]|uniref:C2H2-type domain-containing protein n=1 Tax=Austropuccinia psidii MF-1 TaxID=1389203 RepID=A0A9Q3CIJ5_9BASI|nr:hypothetical protein [Austropuccinia psidii MF-1]
MGQGRPPLSTSSDANVKQIDSPSESKAEIQNIKATFKPESPSRRPIEEIFKKKDRSFFTQTCPSFNKLQPHSASERTSLEILREFFSRPDEHFDVKVCKNLVLKEGSDLGAGSPMPTSHLTSSSHGRSRKRNFFNDESPKSLRKKTRLQKSDKIAESLSGNKVFAETEHNEFRCTECNRKCKTSTSFERHRSACTHREGPLMLECKFCGRPYTYIGYLYKHQQECRKNPSLGKNNEFSEERPHTTP